MRPCANSREEIVHCAVPTGFAYSACFTHSCIGGSEAFEFSCRLGADAALLPAVKHAFMRGICHDPPPQSRSCLYLW